METKEEFCWRRFPGVSKSEKPLEMKYTFVSEKYKLYKEMGILCGGYGIRSLRREKTAKLCLSRHGVLVTASGFV